MKTIVALSTPPITSAISIIRLSGDDALKLASTVFDFKDAKPRYMYYGVLSTPKVKDDCMAVYFKAPKSYTGEDMVEINCHGSVALTKEIISYLIEQGCTMAERGEFTRRAYENGKLDLTECEGVIDLINSQSQAEIMSAYDMMNGTLSKKIAQLQKELITIIAKNEVAIDYPEEGIEESTSNMIKKELLTLKDKLLVLKNSYDQGKIHKDGVNISIIGKPNVGKSQLLNALLGYDRAIVTSVEGTTRDTLEESYIYNGMRFNITDTAGIRESQDEVEKIGIERSRQTALSSDIILAVTEAGTPFNIDIPDKKVIYIENKTDILSPNNDNSIKISALNKTNIDELKQEIYSQTVHATADGVMINNLRQLNTVVGALGYIDNALNNIDSVTLDLIGVDLMLAYRKLGEITGLSSSDEIVGEIFSKFCVGK